MAHSYVEAFQSELQAFRAFAEDFPGRVTFLVDTYDTMIGVRNAIAVIKELGLGLEGRVGIRLDSGDMAQLSVKARRLLDQSGLANVRIFASGSLNELAIDDLVRGGAPIDAFGVGTQMGGSARRVASRCSGGPNRSATCSRCATRRCRAAASPFWSR